MTTTEVLKTNIGEKCTVIAVPAVHVSIAGATAEVASYVHVVVKHPDSDTVNYYEILVEKWEAEVKGDELQRRITRAAERAHAYAQGYIDALQMLQKLGVEVSFRGGLANKSWLPEWLQRLLG